MKYSDYEARTMQEVQKDIDHAKSARDQSAKNYHAKRAAKKLDKVKDIRAIMDKLFPVQSTRIERRGERH